MKEILYHTKFLDLKSITNKKGKSWFYAHRPNAQDVVVILPVFNDEVLFLVEERPPIQAENKGLYTIGTVAGLVGDERENETIDDALKTELLEETGLIADRIEVMAKKVASSAGCTSETFTISIATVRTKTTAQIPIDDGGVIVDRVWVKKNEIKSWLSLKEKEGYVLTAQTLAALYYLT